MLAYFGGLISGGQKGIADIPVFAGIGLLGGAMLRDFAIVATAFEVDVVEARKAGLLGAFSLFLGTILPFAFGVTVALAFGYRDAVSLTTIGAGAITYIVGPVTGAALGANSTVMALSIATGVLKAVVIMVVTPIARPLDRARQSAFRHGVRRLDGNGERGGRRPCRDGPQTGSLRRAHRNVSHGHRLSRWPVGPLPGGACADWVIRAHAERSVKARCHPPGGSQKADSLPF